MQVSGLTCSEPCSSALAPADCKADIANVQTYNVHKQAAGQSMTLQEYLQHCKAQEKLSGAAPLPQDEASSVRQRRCYF